MGPPPGAHDLGEELFYDEVPGTNVAVTYLAVEHDRFMRIKKFE